MAKASQATSPTTTQVARGDAGQSLKMGNSGHRRHLSVVGALSDTDWWTQAQGHLLPVARERNVGWQRGHQNEFRAASTSVRTVAPQT